MGSEPASLEREPVRKTGHFMVRLKLLDLLLPWSCGIIPPNLVQVGSIIVMFIKRQIDTKMGGRMVDIMGQ